MGEEDPSSQSIEKVLGQVDTESVIIYVTTGDALWGVPDLIDTADDHLELICGDNTIALPIEDISGIAPWYETPQAETMYARLIDQTLATADQLNYPYTERSDPFSTLPGHGSIEVDREQAERGSITLSKNQIFYVDTEYLQGYRDSPLTWTVDLTLGILGIGAASQNAPVTKWEGYLRRLPPTRFDDILEENEPVVEGYVEPLETNGDLVREFNDWIGAVIHEQPNSDDTVPSLSEGVLAYFKENGFVTDSRILDDIQQKITVRGDIQRQKMTYGDLEADGFIMVRSAANLE